MTIQEIKNLIKCKAIYKTGSSCILFNSNDVDIVCYFDNELDMKEMKKNYNHIVKGGYCPHYSLQPKVFLGSYIYHYVEKLIGDDIDFLQVDFLEHKKEWCEIAKKYTESERDLGKLWYHILTGCYIIDKNSYNLTDEDKAKIQKVHDNRKVTKTQKEYIDKIINSNL